MRAVTIVLCGALLFVFESCVVGPHYKRATVDTPGTFKEVAPDDLKKMDGWKVAQPQDSALHGKWWEIFGDAQLNGLEEQVSISNQNVAAAFANFMAARAIVREARAQYFPNLTVGASASRAHSSANSGAGSGSGGQTNTSGINDFSLPFDASWTPDLFGRVHNLVRADVANAQATAADLENTRLTAQAEVAAGSAAEAAATTARPQVAAEPARVAPQATAEANPEAAWSAGPPTPGATTAAAAPGVPATAARASPPTP